MYNIITSLNNRRYRYVVKKQNKRNNKVYRKNTFLNVLIKNMVRKPLVDTNQLKQFNEPSADTNQFNEPLVDTNQFNEPLVDTNQVNEPLVDTLRLEQERLRKLEQERKDFMAERNRRRQLVKQIMNS